MTKEAKKSHVKHGINIPPHSGAESYDESNSTAEDGDIYRYIDIDNIYTHIYTYT